MNRKEAAELLPFIKAFGEGKDIEIRSKNTHAQLNGWTKMDEFIFGNFEYRIKPEPKYLLLQMQKSAGRRCKNINLLGG